MLIAFEGIDGSGKTVQSLALKTKLEERGLSCSLFSFPAYEMEVGQLIFDHLHDKNQAFAWNPRVISILYATNRMELRSKIVNALAENQIVICNRYTHSNVAFQGAKVNRQDQVEFIQWIEKLEFEIFELPRPDIVIFLNLAPSQTVQFIAAKKDKTEQGADQYERNHEFLERVYETYLGISKSRDNWIPIECSSGAEIFSKETVASQIAEKIFPHLKVEDS
ncbi:MAG: dTMP kinase [Candidatus Hodarchaeales archaeon]|jgi:dTMP kinase